MTPDPFRALDRTDPPDQWDAIAERAADDTADDVVVDLDTTRSTRRRLLPVAAAVLVVAVVGGAVLATRGDGDDGLSTTATDPTTSEAAGSGDGGPCPFVLDDPRLPTPEPLDGAVPDQAVVSDPIIGAATWRRVTVDDVELLVGVGALGTGVGARDTAVTEADVQIGGSSSGPRNGEDERLDEGTVAVVGSAPAFGGGPGCDLVKVVALVPMAVEDDTEPFVQADLDPARYLEPHRSTIEQVRDAVMPMTPPSEVRCPFRLADLDGVTLDEGSTRPPQGGLGMDAATRRGTIDGRALEVTVGMDEAGNDGHTNSRSSVDGEQVATWTTYESALTADQQGREELDPACGGARVSIDATGFITADDAGNPQIDFEGLAPWYARAEEVLAAIRVDLSVGQETGAEPADPCPFTVDDSTLPSFAVEEPGDEAPWPLLDDLDLTDTWWRAEVGERVVYLGVGAQPGGPLQEPGTRWTGDEADYDTGARLSTVRAYQGLTGVGPCTDAAVFVVSPIPPDENAQLEAGAIQQPDITEAVALTDQVLDAVVVDGATDPDDQQGDPSFGATLPDGRDYRVVVSDGDYQLLVDGVERARRPVPTDPQDVTAVPLTDDNAGLVIGVRPPGTSATTAIGADGKAGDTSLATSADGTLFAIWAAFDAGGAGYRITHTVGDGTTTVVPS